MQSELVNSLRAELNVAQTVGCTAAEGPGRRFALWLQGCPLRCPWCCNPEMLPFTGGEVVDVQRLIEQVRISTSENDIEGVTLLGGEPFAHAEGAAVFAREVQSLGLSVMIFSGYTVEEIRQMPSPAVKQLLAHTDILVDGPYQRELPETGRRWIGSANQRIHFLSDRYSESDQCWNEPNTLEIRFNGSDLTVNGFPATDAVGLWKRIPSSDGIRARGTPSAATGVGR